MKADETARWLERERQCLLELAKMIEQERPEFAKWCREYAAELEEK